MFSILFALSLMCPDTANDPTPASFVPTSITETMLIRSNQELVERQLQEPVNELDSYISF